MAALMVGSAALRRTLCAFAIVFATSYGAIALTRNGHVLAPVWPANALVLVLLLRARTTARIPRFDLVIGGAVGSALANWAGGSSLPLSLWFTLANGAEIAAAFALIRSAKPSGPSVELRATRHLLKAGLLAPALGAMVAAPGLSFFTRTPLAVAWLEWYLTAALGMLIVAPLGLSALSNWREALRPHALRQSVAIALVTGLVATGVYLQDRWPLLFLTAPAILYAAHKQRAFGAALAVGVTALVAVPWTEAGHGPLTLIQGALIHERLFVLQIFLMTQSLTALSVAAVLDERDSLRRALEERERIAHGQAEARSTLLRSVAHEIRTPLNAILGFGDFLSARANLPAQQRIWLTSIIEASTQLRCLANDLLDRARLERGALVVTPLHCEVGALLTEIAAEAKTWPQGERAHIEIVAPHGLRVWADPNRTQQIVRNLLSNAVKYAGAHGPIIVSARKIESAVRVEVRDHGPGVPLARQHEVFEPFASSGRLAGTIDSVHVGLSLVKLLAEAQGGSVGLASTPYVETTFWVTLPTSAPRIGGADWARGAEDEIDPDTVFGELPTEV